MKIRLFKNAQLKVAIKYIDSLANWSDIYLFILKNSRSSVSNVVNVLNMKEVWKYTWIFTRILSLSFVSTKAATVVSTSAQIWLSTWIVISINKRYENRQNNGDRQKSIKVVILYAHLKVAKKCVNLMQIGSDMKLFIPKKNRTSASSVVNILATN